MPTYELTIAGPHLRDVIEQTVTADRFSEEGDLTVFRDNGPGLVFAVRRDLLLTVERLDEPEPDAMATDGAAGEEPATSIVGSAVHWTPTGFGSCFKARIVSADPDGTFTLALSPDGARVSGVTENQIHGNGPGTANTWHWPYAKDQPATTPAETPVLRLGTFTFEGPFHFGESVLTDLRGRLTDK
jgi:hypothetical protein